VNGDPEVDVPLTALGEEQARLLGEQLRHVPLEVCIHTRFPRTRRTAEIALERLDVPLGMEPLLDDINVGAALEGAPIDRYREVKRGLGRTLPFPGGESLDDAARRYAAGLRRLLASDYSRALVICHEIPLRYLLNGSNGSDSLDGPIRELGNAQPFLFDEHALGRAADRIEELVGARPL